MGYLGLGKSCFAAGKHAGAWVSLTASGVGPAMPGQC